MKIIIFKGKHGDDIYDASTPEALARACASHLKLMYEAGWYYPPAEPEGLKPIDQELLDMTEEQIEALPSSIRADVQEKRTKVSIRKGTQERQYAREMRDWKRLLKVVESETLDQAASWYFNESYNEQTFKRNMAWWVVQGRGDWEYEGYDIVTIEEPTW